MEFIVFLTLAYLLGSIPTAVLVSKYKFGIDIREHGSGNAGATNTFRILGKKAGIFVMVVDMLKGVLAVNLAHLTSLDWQFQTEQIVNLQIGLGLCAILGHIFPIWAGFRGGKGVATLFGMILGIHPEAALLLALVFVLILFFTKYVSLSSIVASLSFPMLLFFYYSGQEPSYKIFAIATACLVVLTHHKNIGRLINGNESKVKLKKRND
jgi:glycerol-3-phosphate acyltransferase PlsY